MFYRLVIQNPFLQLRESYETFIRVAVTVVWIITTLLIALFVPDISKVITIIGGISAFFIFVFPGQTGRNRFYSVLTACLKTDILYL